MINKTSTNKNIGVFAILEYENRYLLVKKNYADKTWVLPGGAVEMGEKLEDALKREVYEETGINIDQVCYFGTFFFKPKYQIAIVYHIKLASNYFTKPTRCQEISDIKLFDINDLPIDISRLTKARLNEYKNRGLNSKNFIIEYE